MPEDTDTREPVRLEPPKKRFGGRKEAPKKEKKDKAPKSLPNVSSKQLRDSLKEFFGSFAIAFTFMGDHYCAYIVSVRTPPMCDAWVDLAEKNPAIKRALTRMVTGGDWGKVIFSTLAVALPIAQHHGVYPESMVNPFQLSPDEMEGLRSHMERTGASSNGSEPQSPSGDPVPLG